MMKRKKVKIKGIGGENYAQALKGSKLVEYYKVHSENENLAIPMMLHLAIVNSAGTSIKTMDEWDEYMGGNFVAATDLFHECIEICGSLGAASKK